MITYSWKDSEGRSTLEVFDIEKYIQTRFVDGQQTYSYELSCVEELEYQTVDVRQEDILCKKQLSKMVSYIKKINMIEAIKHTLGICGEHWHPNLWTLLIGGFGFGSIIKFAISYCKCKIKSIFTK